MRVLLENKKITKADNVLLLQYGFYPTETQFDPDGKLFYVVYHKIKGDYTKFKEAPSGLEVEDADIIKTDRLFFDITDNEIDVNVKSCDIQLLNAVVQKATEIGLKPKSTYKPVEIDDESLEVLASAAAEVMQEEQPHWAERAKIVNTGNAEHDEAVMKYMESLKWAHSLTEEQVNYLCDGGWYNNTIRGYLIDAARLADFPAELTQELVSALKLSFEIHDKAAADKISLEYQKP